MSFLIGHFYDSSTLSNSHGTVLGWNFCSISFLIGHLYDISSLSHEVVVLSIWLSDSAVTTCYQQHGNIQWQGECSWKYICTNQKLSRTQLPVWLYLRHETTQGGSPLCVAGLVIIGIGLLGAGLAIGMFFPWTGKRSQTVYWECYKCEVGGGEQVWISDQDATPSTPILAPIPIGTTSRTSNASFFKESRFF